MDLIKRDIAEKLLNLTKNYPVVTLLGPRQSGKSTLVKMSLPDHVYCSLEDPDNRDLAKNDPKAFLKQFTKKVILDEVQRVPELLSYIQGIVDSKPDVKGQYILTGSHQLSLQQEISQSLAGRTALLTLLPFSLSELKTKPEKQSKEDLMFKGFYPRVYKDALDPSTAYKNYYKTYVERDVKQLAQIRNQFEFEKFIKLLAGRTGQLLNLHSLSSDVGVSSTTLSEWITILEASFIIYKLKPFYENIGKRLVKTPKVYFTDTGLLCYLLGIENSVQLGRDPLLGNIFENMVVIEFLKKRLNADQEPNMYFYRDQSNLEIDLLFKSGSTKVIPIEIKSAETLRLDFQKNLLQLESKVLKNKAPGYVIYSGKKEITLETGHIFSNYCNLPQI